MPKEIDKDRPLTRDFKETVKKRVEHDPDFAKALAEELMDKDICPICGYDWEAHEFAVPAPYCPVSDEDAEVNRKLTADLKSFFAGER